MVPDGLAIHFGGYQGQASRHYDAKESKLTEYVQANEAAFGGYVLYGDPAYGFQRYIVSGFKKGAIDGT